MHVLYPMLYNVNETHCFVAGANAISVSISPCNQFVMVGLAARRFAYSPYQSQSKQLMAQIFRLDKTCAAMEVCDSAHIAESNLFSIKSYVVVILAMNKLVRL